MRLSHFAEMSRFTHISRQKYRIPGTKNHCSHIEWGPKIFLMGTQFWVKKVPMGTRGGHYFYYSLLVCYLSFVPHFALFCTVLESLFS